MSEANTRYAAEYSHNGTKWALDIFAESPEDALAKIGSVKTSAVLLGAFEPNVELRRDASAASRSNAGLEPDN